jgi:hypothetical protein
MQRRPVHPRRARLPPPPPRHPAPHEPPPYHPARVYRRALAYFTPDELAEAFAATRGVASQHSGAPSRDRIPCNYYLFQPLIYQVANALLPAEDVAHPTRGMLRYLPNFRFRVAASSVDWERREFHLDDGDRLAIVSETDAAPAKRRAPRQPGTLACATPRPLLNAPGRQLWDSPELRIGLGLPLQPQGC